MWSTKEIKRGSCGSLGKLQNSKHRGKSGWSIEKIKLSSVFTTTSKIYIGWSELLTCGKWLLLWRFYKKLSSCLGEIHESLSAIGVLKLSKFEAMLRDIFSQLRRFNFATHTCSSFSRLQSFVWFLGFPRQRDAA